MNATAEPEVKQPESATQESRINIPLNVDAWADQAPEYIADLTWFHQHALDQGLTFQQCAEALDYDKSTIFRLLKGTYLGSYRNACERIRSYKKISDVRGTITKQTFVENNISRSIFAGLNYALANNSICLITGESRMGKTTCVTEWRDRNNHGRSVLVRCSAYGGARHFLCSIASAVGVSPSLAMSRMMQAIFRSFNENRILLLDEIHNLLPSSRGSKPVALELAREIHDVTGCALGGTATQRFDSELKRGEYMYEQFLGRIGMPVRLSRKITGEDILPIVTQYLKAPSPELLAILTALSNEPQRLGALVEILRIASRMAAKQKKPISEEMILRVLAARTQMMGETQYAAK